MEKRGRKKLDVRSIHFTDEAQFLLSGHVNKQNMWIWGSENPHASIETPKSRKKVMVWCAVTEDKIIGAYFLRKMGRIARCMGYVIRRCSLHTTSPMLRDTVIWGKSPHIATPVLDLLKKNFSDHFWPPLTILSRFKPLRFYLWGYLKSKVYSNPMLHTRTAQDQYKKGDKGDKRRYSNYKWSKK